MSKKEKILTKGIAEKFVANPKSVPLGVFTSLDLAAVEVLARYKIYKLQLDGLVSLSKEAAQVLGAINGYLSLDGLTALSDELAEVLAAHKGRLALNGLATLSDSAARLLSKHEGSGLSLNGLTTLSRAAARDLSRLKGRLELNGLTNVDEVAGELAWGHLHELSLDGVAELSDGAATQLGCLRHYGGELSLSGLKILSDPAARDLAKGRCSLRLNGLTTLSEVAAQKLAGCQHELYLNGLTTLSEAAAEALSMFQGEALHVYNLQQPLPEAVKIRSTWSSSQSPAEILPAGTTVELPDVWGHTSSGQTMPVRISLTLERPMSVLRALAALEKEALAHLEQAGAGEMRHYFIEGVRYYGDSVVFDYGT